MDVKLYLTVSAALRSQHLPDRQQHARVFASHCPGMEGTKLYVALIYSKHGLSLTQEYSPNGICVEIVVM